MLIITFRIDRVFAPAAHQTYDLLGTEVLSQATLNCHLSLRGKLPSFAAFNEVLVGHLIGLFVPITFPTEVVQNLATDSAIAVP